MKTYKELRENPPVLNIKNNAREIVFNIVSVMCDNKNVLVLKKNENGEFKLSGRGYALSNYQMKGDYITDITWAADECDWDSIIEVINSGTSVIESVRSR